MPWGHWSDGFNLLVKCILFWYCVLTECEKQQRDLLSFANSEGHTITIMIPSRACECSYFGSSLWIFWEMKVLLIFRRSSIRVSTIARHVHHHICKHANANLEPHPRTSICTSISSLAYWPGCPKWPLTQATGNLRVLGAALSPGWFAAAVSVAAVVVVGVRQLLQDVLSDWLSSFARNLCQRETGFLRKVSGFWA